MTTPDINPDAYDHWKLANPDDDGERERRLFQVADERWHDLADELYLRWKEGDL